MQSFDVRSEITPPLTSLFNELVRQTNHGVTPLAASAAYEFLRAGPQISNDLWMSRVIALAVQVKGADIGVFERLHRSGPLCAVQLYDLFARKFLFKSQAVHVEEILDAAKTGSLGLAELSMVSIRNLLLQKCVLNSAQTTFAAQRYESNVRDDLSRGKGIWLGAMATVSALGNALNAILENSANHMDKLGLVLLAPGGATNPIILEIAKKFRNAVLINYQSENELIERLRKLNMRVFVEMHGLQNPASFMDSLRYGVANTQLSWAGLPESCPVPFMDGQLLDPVLSQSQHVSCRALPLRCWLPPTRSIPRMVRGSSFGIWAVAAKISETFLEACIDIAARAGRTLQIYTGQAHHSTPQVSKHVVFVDTFEKFQPSVLLDTAPISGGHACLFALLNGIPVVTLPGTGISSRLGASILLNYGFPQGVATDQNSYNELAASFCNLQHIPTPPRHIQWEFMETVGNFFP
jgi:hypothetical protein